MQDWFARCNRSNPLRRGSRLKRSSRACRLSVRRAWCRGDAADGHAERQDCLHVAGAWLAVAERRLDDRSSECERCRRAVWFAGHAHVLRRLPDARGATVVPMRPIGRQVNEVVLDNDSPGVTYTGTWSDDATFARWYDEDYGVGGNDAVPYRFASVDAGAETATATYTPNIPAAGFYPVYTWVAQGSDRTNQLYKINHTGGQTQVSIDHRKVGNGWVYLGTYHFNAGSSASEGSVQISNHSTAGGSVVVADAIRFGNGMGDLTWDDNGIGSATGTTSGQPREDEATVLWLYRSFGQRGNGETPASVLSYPGVLHECVAPGQMAQHMNADTNPFGTSVYIGIHSTTSDPNTAIARSDWARLRRPTPRISRRPINRRWRRSLAGR